ncbi:MAG: sulfotransferase domain-containing protein [Bacteroidota bacterium]
MMNSFRYRLYILFSWLSGVLQRWIHNFHVENRVHSVYKPRPDDVFVVTYPKSGTTWAQNIVYQMLHDGDVSFDHISEVSPFFDTTYQEPSFEQLASPRVIKSHLPYKQSTRADVKFIYVIRELPDVLVSYYHHYQSFQHFRGPIGQFINMYSRGKAYGGRWGLHVAGWLLNKQHKQVYYLRYEQLKTNLAGEIEGLANFLGVKLTPDLKAKIEHQSSFAFMKANQDKYDYYHELAKRRMPEKGQHIRKGKTGEGDVLNEAYLSGSIKHEQQVIASLLEEEVTQEKGQKQATASVHH